MITVYNTLTKKKETFEPVTPGKVGIYLCGPTVYKPSHIGHMVGPVIFDTIKRYLCYSGYDVTFVVNITDVDDKLIAESQKRELTMAQIADEMTEDYKANLAALGVDGVDDFPKCTDHIEAIIAMTKTLVNKGFAYKSDGDVYFDVAKCADYGKLSHRGTEDLLGDGGGAATKKRSLADFALWKSAKEGEPSWESPWGPGRPGWHIECSAMSKALFGETFDIHGGGLDLVFPHHENEVAQSESAHGKPMAKYWMHNGLMQASSEVGKLGGRNTREAEAGDIASQEDGKMSKSKGSSAFRDLLERFPAETIRFFLLSTHYRRPIDYSEGRLNEVGTGMETFYRYFKRFERVVGVSFFDLHPATDRESGYIDPGEDALLTDVVALRDRFLEMMDDDFNTGGGVAALFDLARRLNKYIDKEGFENETAPDEYELASLKRGTIVLAELSHILGLFREPVEASSDGDDELVGNLVELLIEVRMESRKNKDFAMADMIRDKLSEIGVTLEDRPGGTEWSK